jgi:cold shock protein
MTSGTITRLVRERGFGFIQDARGEETFFHTSVLEAGIFDTLHEGQQVEFERERDPRGRGYRAAQVRVTGV